MKYKKWLVQIAGLLALLFLALAALPYFVQHIPSTLQQQIAAKLKQQGYPWVIIRADGRDISVEGKSPDTKTAQSVLQLVKQQGSIARIHDKLTPRLIQPYTMQMTRKGKQLEIDGYVPDQETYQRLILRSHQLFGAANVYENIKSGAGAPPYWNTLLDSGLQALAKLQQGNLDITDRQLYLTGRTLHTETRQAITTDLSRYQGLQADIHIVAADEAEKICQQKFNQLLATNTVQFMPNKAIIDKKSYALLHKLAEVASLCPRSKILIEGHTDNLGSNESNMRLSQKRAQATVAWLFQQGIPTDRLEAVGYGERKPVAPNTTETGRGRNRRIEFKVK